MSNRSIATFHQVTISMVSTGPVRSSLSDQSGSSSQPPSVSSDEFVNLQPVKVVTVIKIECSLVNSGTMSVDTSSVGENSLIFVSSAEMIAPVTTGMSVTTVTSGKVAISSGISEPYSVSVIPNSLGMSVSIGGSYVGFPSSVISNSSVVNSSPRHSFASTMISMNEISVSVNISVSLSQTSQVQSKMISPSLQTTMNPSSALVVSSPAVIMISTAHFVAVS